MPSTSTVSEDTFVPNSVTTCPFTLTFPSVMSVSALRRDV